MSSPPELDCLRPKLHPAGHATKTTAKGCVTIRHAACRPGVSTVSLEYSCSNPSGYAAPLADYGGHQTSHSTPLAASPEAIHVPRRLNRNGLCPMLPVMPRRSPLKKAIAPPLVPSLPKPPSVNVPMPGPPVLRNLKPPLPKLPPVPGVNPVRSYLPKR
jgi:hypothetical protein